MKKQLFILALVVNGFALLTNAVSDVRFQQMSELGSIGHGTESGPYTTKLAHSSPKPGDVIVEDGTVFEKNDDGRFYIRSVDIYNLPEREFFIGFIKGTNTGVTGKAVYTIPDYAMPVTQPRK